MKNSYKFTALLSLLLLCVNCTSEEKEKRLIVEGIEIPDSLKINQIQVLGTHNSYSKPIDTAILNYVSESYKKVRDNYFNKLSGEKKELYKEYHPNKVTLTEALSYNHPVFPEQLNAGIRSLEIDVYYDPDGGRFSQPYAYKALKSQKRLRKLDTIGLMKPGFKILHIPDIDFRTHYTTLEEGLYAIKKWSKKHPKHIPIFIMVETKNSSIKLFGKNSTKIAPFTRDVFNKLDSTIISIMGKEHIIMPDDVQGKYKSLEEAVLKHNWPSVKDVLGKFIFLLLPSTAGLTDKTPYLNSNTLKNRVMFSLSKPGNGYSAFLLKDNAIMRQNEIQEYVKKGYLVRTRADIETYEAKTNDSTRALRAMSSGAQVISTDFYQPSTYYNTNYMVRFPNSSIFRKNLLFK